MDRALIMRNTGTLITDLGLFTDTRQENVLYKEEEAYLTSHDRVGVLTSFEFWLVVYS